MSKYILQIIACCFLLAPAVLTAQTKGATKPETSDPAARAILEKVRQKYEAYQTLEAEFTLIIELPEQGRESQKGKIAQQGDQYRLDLESQTIVSDGKNIWLHLKNNNEIQITSVEDADDESVLSPKDLLHIYEKKNYIYALTNEYTDSGRAMQQIEFKPTDRFSEYAKLRVEIDKQLSQVMTIKAFGKDGSRFTLILERMTPNKTMPSNHFTLDPKAYPGVHVEDLRG